ncbi:hypothetical protein BGZ83_007471 [Gryganskiella cystojenkinii]|nr:hypothetical protein BGZ83_007471 [Gryganskiella cystojenkinii]
MEESQQQDDKVQADEVPEHMEEDEEVERVSEEKDRANKSSSKNQTASASSTPAQTPRPSLAEYRPIVESKAKMTQEEALKKLAKQGVAPGMSGHFLL